MKRAHKKSQQCHLNSVRFSVRQYSSITRRLPSNFKVTTFPWGIKQGKHSTLHILPFHKHSLINLKLDLPVKVDTGQIGTCSCSSDADHIGSVSYEDNVCLASIKNHYGKYFYG